MCLISLIEGNNAGFLRHSILVNIGINADGKISSEFTDEERKTVEEKHRGGVGVERLAHPVEKAAEELVQPQPGRLPASFEILFLAVPDYAIRQAGIISGDYTYIVLAKPDRSAAP